MSPHRRKSRLVPAAFTVLVVASLGFGAVANASFVYLGRVSATSTASATPGPNLPALIKGIESVTAATASVYSAHDNMHSSMDSLKVITNPSGGYLGVYHHIDNRLGSTSKLATSTDLMHWSFKVNLDTQASQPAIIATSDGGFVLATEFNNHIGSGGHVRLRHYASLSALYSASYDVEYTVPRTLSKHNEGTPNIYSVSLNPDITHSVIDVGFHYNDNLIGIDREARGTLTNFSSWTAAVDSRLNGALVSAALAAGQTVKGNIGDRDSFVYFGSVYNLHEIQYVKHDFGTWRPYFYDANNNVASLLNVNTKGGSTAFANPHATILNAPDGKPSLLVTMFVTTQGAATDEQGELIYYFPLP